MLRRSVCTRFATTPSKPIYEILQKARARSAFDPTNPTAAKTIALLHRNHIHTLGCWKDASAAVKHTLVHESEDGAAAAKILDQMLTETTSTADAAAASTSTAPKSAQKLLICYGSQTGTAEALARMTGLMAMSHGVTPVVVTMNDAAGVIKAAAPDQYCAALFMCSTYGIGEFPNNAEEFYNELVAGNLNETMSKIPHAIFGLGNSNNADSFNTAAKLLAEKLTALGSTSLVPPVYSCELAPEGHDTQFRSWKSTIWTSLCTGGHSGEICDVYNIAVIYGLPAERLQRFHWINAHVTYNELKSAKGYEPPFRHMIAEVHLRDQIKILGRKLLVTDQLVVHPHNKKPAVAAVLERFGFTGMEIIEATPLPGAAASWFDAHKISIRTLFREIIDLSAVPSRSTLSMLASAATDGSERKTLDELANDLSASSEYSKLTTSQCVLTVLDILLRFKSITLTLAQIVSRLPHIKPRYYSNAHDPRSKLSEQFHVVYGVPTRHDGARVHKGLATSNLESCTPGASSIWCSIEPGKTTLPAVDAPALIVALGSGIGLVMASLEQRATGFSECAPA